MAGHNVVFTTLDAEQPWSMEAYLAIGGYQAWKKILTEKKQTFIEINCDEYLIEDKDFFLSFIKNLFILFTCCYKTYSVCQGI